MVLYLVLFLYFPFCAYAVFQDLYRGYQKSDSVKSSDLGHEIIHYQSIFRENVHDWKIEFSSNYKDSFLQSLYSFSSNQTISQNFLLGLKKQTAHYGSFSVSHGQIEYDLSNWAASGLNSFSSGKVYEAKNILSYNYDFFKKPFALDLEINAVEKKTQELSLTVKSEKQFFNFYQAYIDTKLKVVLNRLYMEFEKRAHKRVILLRKRTQDGLSRSIELNQARLALISQQETILKNKTSMKENIFALENIIGHNIPEEVYINIIWTNKKQNMFPMLTIQSTQAELEYLKYTNELTEIKLEKIRNDSSHSLNLSIGYAKNSVNNLKSKAFDEASGSGENDEKLIGLTYTLPLGSDKHQSLSRQISLQQKQNNLELEKLQRDFHAQELSLKDNLDAYGKAIDLGQEKINIAQQTIIESQKLYLRGQITFEELLRAEEAYLNAKISLTNLLAAYDKTMGQLAYLKGQIKAFLASYVD